MIRSFNASKENVKEIRGELGNIGQKVDAHAVLIKHLELQMAQLYTTLNPRQPCTLPRDTVLNYKNDGNCMAVMTRGGKQTIYPPKPSRVEDDMRKYVEVV